MEENKKKALERLEKGKEADWVVYTDGSAIDGHRNGGAGVVVTKGSAEGPQKIEEIGVAAGRVASSFQAELYALVTALEWLKEREGWSTAMIISDSQAGLKAL